jgi:A/G-specific adenine glycosylase
MLQQTQASRVAPAYESFLRRFPSAESLAAASTAAVLRQWGTLGYNRRALQLRSAARHVVVHGFPQDLRDLPGVGPYTARAISAFAFGADAAAVEANVRRIIMRLDPSTVDVQAHADELLARGRAAAWNQALMDLGATVCTPRSPDCPSCPLRTFCASAHRVVNSRRARGVPFRATSRYARGRVVAALRSRSMDAREISAATGLDADRVLCTIESLERDGLVSRAGNRVRLGQRARARKASTLATQ